MRKRSSAPWTFRQTTRLCYLFWNGYISLLESPIAENGCPQEELMTNLALLYLNPLSLHLPCIVHPQVELSPCRLLSYVFILRYFCLVLTVLPIFSNLGITVVLLQQHYYSIEAVTDKQYTILYTELHMKGHYTNYGSR